MEIHALEVDKQTNKQAITCVNTLQELLNKKIEQQDISDADKTTKLQQEVLCITHKKC
jgi:hypothetical protein